MKQQKISILIVLVIGIWGFIGYRIYSHFHDEEPVYARVSHKVREEAANKDLERYTLLLSYRDPFLRAGEQRAVLKTVQPLHSEARIVAPKPGVTAPVQVALVNWSKIQYRGVVYNPSRKRKMAALTINGAEHFLQEGEMGDGLRVLVITGDSIQVFIEGNTRYIYKQ